MAEARDADDTPNETPSEASALVEQAPTGRGMFLNAGILYKLAQMAWTRTADPPSDRSPEQLDALVAVLFAAASLEALINELGAMAGYTTTDSTEDPGVRTFATLIAQAEDDHASIEFKFLLADGLFGQGRTYPKGAKLWEDFSLLVDVRNALVHMKEDTFTLIEGIPSPPQS